MPLQCKCHSSDTVFGTWILMPLLTLLTPMSLIILRRTLLQGHNLSTVVRAIILTPWQLSWDHSIGSGQCHKSNGVAGAIMPIPLLGIFWWHDSIWYVNNGSAYGSSKGIDINGGKSVSVMELAVESWYWCIMTSVMLPVTNTAVKVYLIMSIMNCTLIIWTVYLY